MGSAGIEPLARPYRVHDSHALDRFQSVSGTWCETKRQKEFAVGTQSHGEHRDDESCKFYAISTTNYEVARLDVTLLPAVQGGSHCFLRRTNGYELISTTPQFYCYTLIIAQRTACDLQGART